MSDILFDAETSNRRVLPSLNSAFASRIDMDFLVQGKRVSVRESGRTQSPCPTGLAGARDLAEQWPPQVALAVDWGDGQTELTIGPETSQDGANVTMVVKRVASDIYRLEIGWRLRQPNPVGHGRLVAKLLRNTQPMSARAALVCEDCGLRPTKPRGCQFVLGDVERSGAILPSPAEFLRNVLLFSLINLGVAFKTDPAAGWTGSPLW